MMKRSEPQIGRWVAEVPFHNSHSAERRIHLDIALSQFGQIGLDFKAGYLNSGQTGRQTQRRRPNPAADIKHGLPGLASMDAASRTGSIAAR